MEEKFGSMIFFETENESKLTDEEWAQNEKVRELQMKKLMTVTKSKFYMLKINYSKIFKLVDFEKLIILLMKMIRKMKHPTECTKT